MKRFLLLALTAGLSLPVQAGVDPEVHKLCLKASDYKGCVEAQSGKANSIEVLNNSSAKTSKGNACPQMPLQMAYEGVGTCREVRCEESFLGFINLSGNHHSQLGGGKLALY